MSGRHASPRQTPKRGRGTNTGPTESPQTWSSNDKRIEQQLGPMWSLSETTTFFNAVKQGRNDWDGIASKLTGKTPENLMNLYKMYKTYLELPEASALALFTILQSVYSMPGLLGGDDDSNMRRTRSKTVTPKPNNKDNNSNNSTNTTPKTPASKPVARRTRKQLFPDDTPTTPKRGGGQPSSSAPSSSSSSSNLRTPSPLKSTPSRKRKTGRHDSPPVTPIRTVGSSSSSGPGFTTPSASLASTPDSQLPLKLRGKVWKGKISPLRQDGSKSTPTHSSQQSADTLQSHKIIHDRLVNFFSSRSTKTQNKHEVALSAAGRWAVYEWFYSDIDRAYFHVNDFQDCLNDLGLSKIRKLTRVEWAHVRSAMGKPRRLSRAFLKQERCKLYNTRANVRSMRIGEPPSTSTAADAGLVPQEIPQSLAVGAKVLGYHHKALKKGVVQSSDSAGSKYRVAFEGHSTSLWIKDVDLMSLYDEYEDDDSRIETPATSKRRKVLDMTPNGAHNHGENNNLKTPSSQNRAYTRPELVNIASLVTLLDRKDDLLAELTAMNNQAEKMLAQSQEYPGWFQQRYAVLIVKLDEVNRRLEPALVRLHASRSSPPSHTPTIARTFTDISMLDFREQNWGETAISECRQQSQALVKEHMNAFSVNSLMRDYVAECVCLLLQLRACASHVQLVGPEEATPDVITSLDYLLSTVKPKSEENMALFSEIEQSVNMLKTKLTSSRSIPPQNYTNIAT